jgi:hypothetical protein
MPANVMIRLIQLRKGTSRRVAMVEEPHIRFLNQFTSVHELVRDALVTDTSISERIRFHASTETLLYDAIYRGRSAWQLLPPIDYPNEPARCLVSGTGLTHLGSAKDRNAMHEVKDAELTDSMKMFRWGVEGGRPAVGKIGIPPEWFFKGPGTILRAHGEPLDVPPYAEDGGEEAEIAGIYMIGPEGQPLRVGMAIGNEFSDHRFEKKNYLNLAGSKIRTCAIGPELVIDPAFQSVPGKVRIERDGKELWAKEILTGEAEMCHSLQNIEHHHFKFETHRRPGDIHVHYFGACSLSFGAGVRLIDGDVMEIHFEGFGRPLRNPVRVSAAVDSLIPVQPLK